MSNTFRTAVMIIMKNDNHHDSLKTNYRFQSMKCSGDGNLNL